MLRFDPVVLAVGYFGSLATVALGAVVWGCNSREAVVSTRLDNLEKQIENLAFRLETSSDRLAGEVAAWSRLFSQRIDSAHTLAALQPSKAGNSGAHVSNV